MSRCGRTWLRVAELPREVLAAFGSPLEVQFGWASNLASVVQRDKKAAVAAARQAAKDGLAPAQAYAAITGKALRKGGVVPYNTAAADPPAGDGEGAKSAAAAPRRFHLGRGAYAQVRSDGARTVIEFDSKLLPDGVWPELEKALRGRK